MTMFLNAMVYFSKTKVKIDFRITIKKFINLLAPGKNGIIYIKEFFYPTH